MNGIGNAKLLAFVVLSIAALAILGLGFKGGVMTRPVSLADEVLMNFWWSGDGNALILSSNVPNAEILALAAKKRVTVVRYDAKRTSPANLLEKIRERIGGRPIRRLAMAVESQGQNSFSLTAGTTVNLPTVQVNKEVREFFRGLGRLVGREGSIDILACDFAAGQYGVTLINALEELTGAEVTASINSTGSADRGGDWVLEKGDVDIAALYFNGESLERYSDILANPSLVKDIKPGGTSSNPAYLTGLNGILLFSANNGTNGVELWRSDGTPGGTAMVKDIRPGGGNGNPEYLAEVNGALYFRGNDGTHGVELWKSDGTPAGTILAKDVRPGGTGSNPENLTDVNGVLFFSANGGTNGVELWKSDGTSGGTVLVKDIRPGGTSSNPENLTEVNGVLFFSANAGTNGIELWKSDGTSGGTVLVKDIRPGGTSSNPENLTDVNGVLFFSANAGANGAELWKSDGTSGGTVMVRNIRPGGNNSNPENLAEVNGVLFFSANDGTNGVELWKSDGTSGGTVMVKNIRPGGNNSNPGSLTEVNGALFFSANDGMDGYELWKSDGTTGGTVLLQDIRPGGGSSNPENLKEGNGFLFFSANNGTDGYELWTSDGTSGGTIQVEDIRPGSGSSNPGFLEDVNGIMFFSANDATNGNELWRYTPGDGTDSFLVSIPDTAITGALILPGDTVLLPVLMEPVEYDNHNGIYSYQLEVLYSASLFECVGYESSGTILDNYGGLSSFMVQFRTDSGMYGAPDTIRLAAASDDSIYYPEVIGAPFEFPRPLIKLKFRTSPYIAPDDCTALSFASFKFNEGIPGAVTNDGSLTFHALHQYGDVDQDGHILPFDAALVLRHIIHDTVLVGAGLTAAEVSGNGEITMYDVWLILMYHFGSITTFPAGDYFKRALPSNRSAELALKWGELKDGMLTILVNAGNLAKVYGYSMELAYDPNTLTFRSAGLTDFTQGMISVVKPEEGIIRLAAAGSEPIEGDGALARLTFRVTGEARGEDIIRLKEVILNEEIILSNASPISIPGTYSLEQNYPNPFNPTTRIRYQIPEAAHVQITIFNLLGQRVRTLVNEAQSAGSYDVMWDATNDNGVKLASELYIYQMKAGNFIQTRKLIVMK